MGLRSFTPGRTGQLEDGAGLHGTALTWIGKPRVAWSRNAVKTRNIFRSILQTGACPYLCRSSSAAARYTSRACSARAEKSCTSQWGPEQEANFFSSLNSQFSPWASPGAVLLLSLWSIASLVFMLSFMPLSRAGSASRLCCHALPLFLGGSFLKCLVWRMPPRKPLFLDNFPEYCIDGISDGRWFFSLCHRKHRRPQQYRVALEHTTHHYSVRLCLCLPWEDILHLLSLCFCK